MDEKRRAPDRRVLRTKRAIRSAFAQLLSEKDINDVTIRDIADRADINRNTFYKYYAGIYQLIDEIENDVVAKFDCLLEEVDTEWSLDNTYVFFDKLTAIINTDIDFYGHLLAQNSNVSLITKVGSLLMEKTKQVLLPKLELKEEALDRALIYAFSGMLSAYQAWFNTPRRCSLEELSRSLRTLCIFGFSGLLEEETEKE